MPVWGLVAVVVALALSAPAAAQEPTVPPEQPPPEQTPSQALFEDLIVKDPRTTVTVRTLLQSDAGLVGPQPTFADLTGDGRADAVVDVRIPGAAGTIAVFVFSTDGTSADQLRAVFRSQALYRATTFFARRLLIVSQPRWARGDDLCCPAGRERRRYVWDARTHTLRREKPAPRGLRTPSGAIAGPSHG
jgi:hypothetical protein